MAFFVAAIRQATDGGPEPGHLLSLRIRLQYKAVPRTWVALFINTNWENSADLKCWLYTYMTLDIYNFFIYQHVLQMRGSCTVTSELSSCQFFCLPDCLSVCLSVCRAVCLSGCISFCLSVRLFSQFSVYICQSSCMLFLSLPVCPLVRIGLSKGERIQIWNADWF